jgi:uncharacterized protein YggT (Ycf19 family)
LKTERSSGFVCAPKCIYAAKFSQFGGICGKCFFGGSELESFIYVIVTTLRYLVIAMQMLLIVDAVLSWLPLDEDNPFARIVYLLTAPIVLPIRAFLERFRLFQELPIDMSNLFGIIILSIIEMFLIV